MDEITKTQRQTQAYWFVDGIAELVGGAILAVVGILLYASTLGTSDVFSTMALMVMIVGFPLSAKAVKTVKDRVTHERTGYVRFAESTGRRKGVVVAVAAALGVGFAVYVASTGDFTFEGVLGTAMLAALGSTLTITLALRAYRLELSRFYVSAAVVALGTVGCLLLSLGFVAGMGVLWTALGVTSMLFGATVFAEYLAKHPETETDAT